MTESCLNSDWIRTLYMGYRRRKVMLHICYAGYWYYYSLVLARRREEDNPLIILLLIAVLHCLHFLVLGESYHTALGLSLQRAFGGGTIRGFGL